MGAMKAKERHLYPIQKTKAMHTDWPRPTVECNTEERMGIYKMPLGKSSQTPESAGCRNPFTSRRNTAALLEVGVLATCPGACF